MRSRSSLRQVVETTFHLLCEVFGLSLPRAPTLRGLETRLSAKVAAFNMGVPINCLFRRPAFSFFGLFG